VDREAKKQQQDVNEEASQCSEMKEAKEKQATKLSAKAERDQEKQA
jgi:hypothetical protein